MNSYYLFVVGIFMLFSSSILQKSEDMITVITYNIRYDSPRDGKDNWKFRKEAIANFITAQSPDFLGIQEAMYHQAMELDSLLPDYNWVGVGRNDGSKDGEFTPIYYKKNKYSIEKTGVFWLSETPEIIGSKGWDTALPRIATWAIFKNNNTDSTYFVLNTHFDHRGEQARIESAKLILKQTKALNEGHSSILMGDLNVTPSSKVYATFTKNTDFFDTKKVSQTPSTNKKGTFNNFKIRHLRTTTIDYIFVNKELKVQSYEVPAPKANDRQASDHYPIVVRIME